MIDTNAQKGFTLIELLIVLSILSVLLFFAIPSFQQLFIRSDYNEAISHLENDLLFAKKNANRLRQNISLCHTDNGYSCSENTLNLWGNGWIIFKDRKRQFTPTQDDILRYRKIPRSKHLKITTSRNIGGGLSFDAGRKSGRGLGGGLPNGSFFICATNLTEKRIILNIYGNFRTENLISC